MRIITMNSEHKQRFLELKIGRLGAIITLIKMKDLNGIFLPLTQISLKKSIIFYIVIITIMEIDITQDLRVVEI